MDKGVIVSSSPHIHSGDSIKGIMMDVIIALIPAGVAGIYFFGLSALWVIATAITSCVVFEALWQKIMKKPISVNDLSAVVTGVLLAYNLPPTLPLWMVVIGSLFSIIIVKQLFGGLGQNFMNPALAGRAFLLAAWAGDMTKWTIPSIFGSDVGSSVTSGATPLALMKQGAWDRMPTYMDAFLGNIGGCIGETSAVLLIIGGLYLVIKGVIKLRTPVAFILTVASLTFIFGGGTTIQQSLNISLYHILTGGLMLGAFFMATDYSTSPVTPLGQIIMGIGCGIITVAIRLKGGYPEGVSYSILIMNVATPLIDRYTMPRVFGHTSKLIRGANKNEPKK